MSDKYIILSAPGHLLHDDLKKLDHYFCDLTKDDPFEEEIFENTDARAVLDFCSIEKEDKFYMLTEIHNHWQGPIISELSCNWGDLALHSFPQLVGALGTNFATARKAYEFYAKDEETAELITSFLATLFDKGIRVDSPGTGFTFPRVVSQIINEAYYAFEDNLASKEDIDRAMKYGVNYPKGPFEWAKEIGVEKILMLLEDLYDSTKDPRYRVCPGLQLDAFRN
jgi:3-hydroxybutyryl-CoA dehydrogenase